MFHVIEAPLAFIAGALHALPSGSSATYCSGYIISSRSNLVDAISNFNTNQTLSGYTKVHDAIGFVDNMGAACYNAFAAEISVDHMKGLLDPWYSIPLNVVYNLGNMWVNFINYKFYTPETVPSGDWAFFVVYTLGDFLMRFVYNETTALD